MKIKFGALRNTNNNWLFLWFPSRTAWNCKLLKNDLNDLTWNFIRFEFMNKTSITNLAKIPRYIEWYPIMSWTADTTSIMSWTRKSGTISKIRKSHFPPGYHLASFSKILLATEKRLSRHQFSWCTPLTKIFKYGRHKWDFPIIWKTTFLKSHIKKLSYVWSFRFTALQNHHWHTISIRCL